MKKICLVLCALLAGTLAFAQQRGDVVKQADGYEWPTDPQVLEKLDQWQDLKFGDALGHLFSARNRGVLEHMQRGLDPPPERLCL